MFSKNRDFPLCAPSTVYLTLRYELLSPSRFVSWPPGCLHWLCAAPFTWRPLGNCCLILCCRAFPRLPSAFHHLKCWGLNFSLTSPPFLNRTYSLGAYLFSDCVVLAGRLLSRHIWKYIVSIFLLLLRLILITWWRKPCAVYSLCNHCPPSISSQEAP